MMKPLPPVDGDSSSRPDSRAVEGWLVAAARCGDRAALAALVSRWQRRLTAHAARQLGNADAARDAVQAAWVEIMRGLPFRPPICWRRCALAFRRPRCS